MEKKKIPVFVSKFGEIVFNFLVFFSPFIAFFSPKETLYLFAECGRAEGTTQNIYHYGNWCFREE